MEYKKIKIKVTGIFPLMTSNPDNMDRGDGSPKPSKKILPPEEEAKQRLYLDENGSFCLKTCAFRNSFLDALKRKKIGRVNADKVIAPAIFTVDTFTKILNPETWEPVEDYVVDTRVVNIGGKKSSKVWRSRPLFDPWGAIVEFELDEEIISIEQVIEEFNYAGKTKGVGDFRVECRGQFGSFSAELYEDVS